MSLDDVLEKIGPIEQGTQLQISKLSLDELNALVACERVTKNQKKRITKRIKWLENEDERQAKRREKRKSARKNRTTPFVKIYEHPVCKTREERDQYVCIGLDFGLNGHMIENEVKDMSKQSQTCYSIQRRFEMPSQLFFLEFTDQLLQLYQTYLPGIGNWTVNKSDTIANNVANAVYLTAEADEPLETVDKGIMYIIGGIVDRNRLPGLCHARAIELNIPQRRLPIKENVKLSTRCVLTVPHVYQLLLKRGQGQSWKDALKSTLSKKKIIDSDNDE